MPTPIATQRSLLGLLVLTTLAPLARAQEQAAPEPAQVIVSATGYRTTGTKSGLKPLESPMSYEVYDKELLATRQADSVTEALRYVPA